MFGLLFLVAASVSPLLPNDYIFVHSGVIEIPEDLSQVIESDQQGRFKVVEQDGYRVVLDMQSTGITFNQKIAEGLEEFARGNEQEGLELIQAQVAPLVLSWIIDPTTNSTPYSKMTSAQLTPSYGIDLNVNGSENQSLRNAAPHDQNQNWLDVTTIFKDKNPQTLGQNMDRLSFVAIGRRLSSEQERSRHSLAMKTYWDTYEQVKARYNTAMIASMDKLYRDSGIAFNLNRNDKGKQLNELSADRRQEIRDITGFDFSEDLESATIEQVWKTMTVSFSVATPRGSREGVLFELLSQMP